MKPNFYWVLGVEDDKALSNSVVKSGSGSVLQRLMYQLTRHNTSDTVETTGPAPGESGDGGSGGGGGGGGDDEHVEDDDDPGKSALATAGVLFEEGKLSQEVCLRMRMRKVCANTLALSCPASHRFVCVARSHSSTTI